MLHKKVFGCFDLSNYIMTVMMVMMTTLMMIMMMTTMMMMMMMRGGFVWSNQSGYNSMEDKSSLREVIAIVIIFIVNFYYFCTFSSFLLVFAHNLPLYFSFFHSFLCLKAALGWVISFAPSPFVSRDLCISKHPRPQLRSKCKKGTAFIIM